MRWSALWLGTGRPNRRILPALGLIRPSSILIVVVLPLPLGPRKPTISPRCTVKLTFFTASTVLRQIKPVLKVLRRSTTSISFSRIGSSYQKNPASSEPYSVKTPVTHGRTT